MPQPREGITVEHRPLTARGTPSSRPWVVLCNGKPERNARYKDEALARRVAADLTRYGVRDAKYGGR